MKPEDANTHHWYALRLSQLGRHEEAIKEIKLAHELDPLAPRIRVNVGIVSYFARRYDEALAELKKALDFDPSHTVSSGHLGREFSFPFSSDSIMI